FDNPPATHETHPLSLHDALPISWGQLHGRPEASTNRHALRYPQKHARVRGKPKRLARTMVNAAYIPWQIHLAGKTNTAGMGSTRSEEHTSELQSLRHLVCRLLLE